MHCMHPACFPPQTQRAQMFSFLSCEGALQVKGATRKRRKQYCRKRKNFFIIKEINKSSDKTKTEKE